MHKFCVWGQRSGASAGWTLADLMLNALGGVTLFLLPLLHRVDAEGKRAEHFQGVAAVAAKDFEKAEKDVEELTTENEGLHGEVSRQGGVIDELTTGIGLLKTENTGLKRTNIALGDELGLMGDKIGEYQVIIDTLERGRPVDVVFLFDTSASMELQNSRVRRAIGLVGELLPRVTQLRIGVLTFQQTGYKSFPLQELQRPEADHGLSRAQLAKFLADATVANGLVDVADATRRGMAMFDTSAQAPLREVLVLVSDVAPGDVAGISEQDCRRMKQELQAWTQEPGSDRRFLALFGHDPGFINPDYDPARHRAVYRWLAKMPQGRFEDQASAVFPVLFETMFAN